MEESPRPYTATRGTKRIVISIVDPSVRAQIDAATETVSSITHLPSIGDAIELAKEQSFSALLVSPSYVNGSAGGELARLVNRCPGITSVAVVCERLKPDASDLLMLGASGVREAVNVEDPSEWNRLRWILARADDSTSLRIANGIAPALLDASAPARRFFYTLIRLSRRVASMRAVASEVGVNPNTITTRFYRLRLPSPKKYLDYMRLLHASALLEKSDVSGASAARQLNYSSPQAFGRHLWLRLGATVTRFRCEYPFPAFLQLYSEQYLLPFSKQFAKFEPLR